VQELPRDVIVEPPAHWITNPVIEIEPPIIEMPIIHETKYTDVYIQDSMYSNGPHLAYLDDSPSWVPGRARNN